MRRLAGITVAVLALAGCGSSTTTRTENQTVRVVTPTGGSGTAKTITTSTTATNGGAAKTTTATSTSAGTSTVPTTTTTGTTASTATTSTTTSHLFNTVNAHVLEAPMKKFAAGLALKPLRVECPGQVPEVVGHLVVCHVIYRLGRLFSVPIGFTQTDAQGNGQIHFLVDDYPDIEYFLIKNASNLPVGHYNAKCPENVTPRHGATLICRVTNTSTHRVYRYSVVLKDARGQFRFTAVK